MKETFEAVYENAGFRPLRVRTGLGPSAASPLRRQLATRQVRSSVARIGFPSRMPARYGRPSTAHSSQWIRVTGSSLALDTSIAIAVLAGEASSLLSPGIGPFLLPVPVVGEFRDGALNSRRKAQSLVEVEAPIGRCHVLDITTATAKVYTQLRLHRRELGKPIPENDRRIAWVGRRQ